MTQVTHRNTHKKSHKAETKHTLQVQKPNQLTQELKTKQDSLTNDRNEPANCEIKNNCTNERILYESVISDHLMLIMLTL